MTNINISEPLQRDLQTLISRVACCLNGRDLARRRLALGRVDMQLADNAARDHAEKAEMLAKVFEQMGGLDILGDLAIAMEAATAGETAGLDPKGDGPTVEDGDAQPSGRGGSS